MPDTAQRQVIDLIKRSKNILIMPSSPPDGDSIGSAVSLYLVLKKLGKEASIVSKDPVPELLHFLPDIKMIGDMMNSNTDFIISIDCSNVKIGEIKETKEGDKIKIVLTPKEGHISEEIISFNKGKTDYDLIVTVDCAELTQLGSLYENNIELFHQIPVINIDHHISNTHFGKVNYVDIMASSTTELLMTIFEELEKEEKVDLINEDIATLLLTGIITDTGSFQNANTTPRSFARSAQLISYGARQQEIIQHIYKTKQLSQLKLWGRVLTNIQTDEKYKMVWSLVTQKDFKDTESTEDQTGDIIDELMTNAPGAEVIFLIKEREDETVSVSLRTTNPAIDASKIAESFGGGGHARAAGFRITGMSAKDAEFKVLNGIREIQKERLEIVDEEKNEPMINVEELIQRAKEAQKATDIIEEVKEKKQVKKKKTLIKKSAEIQVNKEIETPKEEDYEITYKFED